MIGLLLALVVIAAWTGLALIFALCAAAKEESKDGREE